jgi:hypothetical protein
MQRRHRFKAAPACAGQRAASLLDRGDRALRPPGLKLVQRGANRGKIVVCRSQQRHNPQPAKLSRVIQAIVAAMFAERLQQALLLPEAQRRNPHANQPRCRADMQPLGSAGMRLRGQLRRQDLERRQRLSSSRVLASSA